MNNYLESQLEKLKFNCLVGENIQNLREEKHLTQVQLAERIGASQSMVAQLESGAKALTVGLGKDIALALNCPLEALLDDHKEAG